MRIIDVVDHTNVVDDELVFRVPQEGSGDLRFGSQLIVGENQAAIFVRAGQALDAFTTGRHTLSVANLPILSSLIGLATSGRTPFTASTRSPIRRTTAGSAWPSRAGRGTTGTR